MEAKAELVAWFRIVYVFNAWALTIVLGVVGCLFYASTTGSLAAVPRIAWILVIANGACFALYFLLSGYVAEWLERTGRTPTALERLGERLAAWDETGRE